MAARTIARDMEIDVAAHNHFRTNRLEMPSCLTADALRHRYIAAAISVVVDKDQSPKRIGFADGSIAQRDVADGFVWREWIEDENSAS